MDENEEGIEEPPSIHVRLQPCNKYTETEEDKLPKKFDVEDPETELLGKENFYYLAKVNQVLNLPKEHSYNCFVQYQFKWTKKVFSTKYFPGSSTSPELNYAMMHRIDELTYPVIHELLHGCISFKVFAYPHE